MPDHKVILDQLDYEFRGPDGKHQVTKEYRDLSPAEALKKAIKYYQDSQLRQDRSRSDFTYWLLESDLAVAQCLIAVFKHLADGKDDFPPIPDVEGKAQMDRTATLVEWAQQVVSDHKHLWEGCFHNWDDGQVHTACKRGEDVSYSMAHDVCSVCGIGKYESLSLEKVVH